MKKNEKKIKLERELEYPSDLFLYQHLDFFIYADRWVIQTKFEGVEVWGLHE